MKNMKADSPSMPFGGPEEVAFTPDGKAIVFCAKEGGSSEAWSTNFDLYLAPIDASAAPRNLTEANKAFDTRPMFSPDGKSLAWLAMARPGYEADRQAIMVMSWPDGKPREIAPKWDRSAEQVVWSKNGKTMYVVATNLGNQSLFTIDVARGDAKTIQAWGWINSIAGVSGKRVIFDMDHLRSPAEIYSASSDKDMKQITNVNADLLAGVRFGEPEQFSFKGANNDEVYAWVVKPADFDASKKYPVFVFVYGEPAAQTVLDQWGGAQMQWHQMLADRGYVVVSVDPRGTPAPKGSAAPTQSGRPGAQASRIRCDPCGSGARY
jgi:dipeptidyl aminopeptidase/acylaminoacyl peptidase